MKAGFAVGGDFRGRGENIYDSLVAAGMRPDFLLYCFPDARRVPSLIERLLQLGRLQGTAKRLGKWAYALTPTTVLRAVFRSWLPEVETQVHYVKGINSEAAFRVLLHERPDVLVVVGCGIVGKRLCETFRGQLLNAHAGKLPGFRGMNNVEWAYLEDAPLVGTIHFIVPAVDAGDIVYEQELNKEQHPTSIDQIRENAFGQVFDLFPQAIQAMQQDGFKPKRQPATRTTRYVLHPFLRYVLERKLGIVD